ncbi:hypothetical protein BWQ96_06486 [Gracilariopsis chorda]|uniref:Uncharacterized protein n=1 Tax=Gracilariopsis chorda TaxID=448386 RepID=A0A2V3INW1_9FLOR|nr:hypothetical protein BWQ96_06486 [Gracilariopsis chorda]|eukprot:PXF43754.1 hypothetical protein BWQ96_06486 [Gracilariopsis chorda]
MVWYSVPGFDPRTLLAYSASRRKKSLAAGPAPPCTSKPIRLKLIQFAAHKASYFVRFWASARLAAPAASFDAYVKKKSL